MEPGVLEFLLAAVGFLASSAGATMLLLGGHIFDQVRISERWAPRNVLAPRANGNEQTYDREGSVRAEQAIFQPGHDATAPRQAYR